MINLHFFQVKQMRDCRIEIPEMFMIENLTEVVIQRMNEEITEENYLEVCKIAEMYNNQDQIKNNKNTKASNPEDDFDF